MRRNASTAVRALGGLFFSFFLVLHLPSQANTDNKLSESSETRIALVIGNGSYLNLPLKNPANDAKDVAAKLAELGFSVFAVIDGDLLAMNRAIRDFGNAIKRPDAVALFYYSGHGVQYRGANYLIPAKSDIQAPDELAFSAVNAELVYAKMESAGNKTNIVILDACRNNPFPGAERGGERGLAVVGNVQPPQSLIVYSTAPGKTAQDGEGRNGVFTAALLKHLADPALDAELMIRRVREEVIAGTGGVQVPWHNSSISGSGFAFAGGASLYVTTDPPGAEVFIDGKSRGFSPLSIGELPRFNDIVLSARSGNLSSSRRINLKNLEEKQTLKLEVARGNLKVTTDETGFSALVDGQKVEVGPSGEIAGLEIGEHAVELRGNSSLFRSRVEIVAGKTARIEAALVPQGLLTLTIPQNTVCRIQGMGIDEITSQWNYGELPAGPYLLTVNGGDYEPFSESISIVRGKTYNFSPKPRYTIEYLTARYGAELERLDRVADSKIATQIDMDDAAILAKRIRAEGRIELEALAVRADEAQKRLATLRPKPTMGGEGGSGIGAHGPAALYSNYALEYEELRALEANDGILPMQEDIDRVSAFAIKVMAQPYQDFQALAAKAEALRDRLILLKDKLDLEDYQRACKFIEWKMSSDFAIEIFDLGGLDDIISDLETRKGEELRNFLPQVKKLREEAVAYREKKDRSLKLAMLIHDRADEQLKLKTVEGKRRSGTALGSTFLAGGGLGAAASLLLGYFAIASYAQYSSAATSSEAAGLREEVEQYGQYALVAAGAGGGLAALGMLSLFTRPDPESLRRSVESLDREIEELRRAE